MGYGMWGGWVGMLGTVAFSVPNFPRFQLIASHTRNRATGK